MLGTYSINENGDTSLADYGAYTVEAGALKFRPDGQARQLVRRRQTRPNRSCWPPIEDEAVAELLPFEVGEIAGNADHE